MSDDLRVSILLFAILCGAGVVGMLVHGFMAAVDALVGIRAELADMNALARADWDDSYKKGRIEPPTKLLRKAS